jgi:hypothetical protein
VAVVGWTPGGVHPAADIWEGMRMTREEEKEKIILLLRIALSSVKEAEKVNGQPLFYSEHGFSVDIEAQLEETIKQCEQARDMW